jgi:hypothetical protein
MVLRVIRNGLSQERCLGCIHNKIAGDKAWRTERVGDGLGQNYHVVTALSSDVINHASSSSSEPSGQIMLHHPILVVKAFQHVSPTII